MSRSTENKLVDFDATRHIYKGNLVPQFNIPTYKVARVDASHYPLEELVIFEPNINLMELQTAPAKKLADLLESAIDSNLEYIASAIARHYHEYNWAGVSFGIYWGDTPINLLRRVLAHKRLTHDSSVSQLGGERNKRITQQGFYLPRRDGESNFWQSL